jgi:hypothetical protein
LVVNEFLMEREASRPIESLEWRYRQRSGLANRGVYSLMKITHRFAPSR